MSAVWSHYKINDNVIEKNLEVVCPVLAGTRPM